MHSPVTIEARPSWVAVVGGLSVHALGTSISHCDCTAHLVLGPLVLHCRAHVLGR